MAANTINLCTLDTKKLRWTFKDEETQHDVIFTDHTVELHISDETNSNTEIVTAEMFLGDSGLYFDIPTAVNQQEAEFEYRIVAFDADGERKTIEKGILSYE